MTKPTSQPSITPDDSAVLIDGCRYCLSQCEQILSLVSQEHYNVAADGASVGAHMRHVLDRFQCFFAGLENTTIDYDARKRDRSIEGSPDAANFALVSVAKRVEGLAFTGARQNALTVHESVHHQGPAITIPSTIERELMSLITHSTHHLAIIALLLKPLGYSLGDDFGKAASTIRFEQGISTR